MAGKVNIVQKGPSGTVQYVEGWLKKNICEFPFEFGGGNTVASVWFTAEDKWDSKYPWAAGRHKEILEFVAEHLRRTQAPKSTVVWQKDRFDLVNQ
jgi:hypothetical protein